MTFFRKNFTSRFKEKKFELLLNVDKCKHLHFFRKLKIKNKVCKIKIFFTYLLLLPNNKKENNYYKNNECTFKKLKEKK